MDHLRNWYQKMLFHLLKPKPYTYASLIFNPTGPSGTLSRWGRHWDGWDRFARAWLWSSQLLREKQSGQIIYIYSIICINLMCSNVHGLSSGFGAWRCISWWGWGQINAYIGHICFFRYSTTHTQDAPPTNRWLNPLSGKNLQRLQTLEGWRPKCSIPNPSYYTNYCAPHLILTCGVSRMPLWVIVLLNSSSQAVMGPNLKFNIYKLCMKWKPYTHAWLFFYVLS